MAAIHRNLVVDQEFRRPGERREVGLERRYARTGRLRRRRENGSRDLEAGHAVSVLGSRKPKWTVCFSVGAKHRYTGYLLRGPRRSRSLVASTALSIVRG